MRILRSNRPPSRLTLLGLFFMLFTSAILNLGCIGSLTDVGGTLGRDNTLVKLTANMQGARQVAVTKENGEPVQVGEELTGLLESLLEGTLVQIDDAGNTSEVLNAYRVVYYVLQTDNYVISAGEFSNILDADDNPIDCYLIAFSKTAAGDPVACLSQKPVGLYSPFDEYPLYRNKGVSARGGEVYFVTGSSEFYEAHDDEVFGGGFGIFIGSHDSANQVSELRLWTEGSDTTELMFQLEAADGNRLDRVFASTTNENVCATAFGVNNESGKAICGQPSDSSSWTVVGLAGDVTVPQQIGNLVWLGAETIDLDDLSVDATVGNASAPALDTEIYALGNGDHVALCEYIECGENGENCDNAGIVNLNSANGVLAITVVDNSVEWERIKGNGSYIWIYGGDKLQRIAAGDGALDSTNFIVDLNLLQVTDMSFTALDSLRVDAKAGIGDVILYIDSDGTTSIETTELDRFEEVVYLQAQSGCPVAEALTDQPEIDEGASVSLNGTASFDLQGLALAYSWLQTGGVAVDLDSPSSETPSFIAPAVDGDVQLTFELTVSNGNCGSTDTVTITIRDTDIADVIVADTNE